MATHAYSHVFVRSHSIVFCSDSMHTALRELIRENGLDPDKLMQEWATIERGVRTWLDSGHLNNIVVEFYTPWSSVASARWDFPVGYGGTGGGADPWAPNALLGKTNSETGRPPTGCDSLPLPFTPTRAPARARVALRPCSRRTGSLARRR